MTHGMIRTVTHGRCPACGCGSLFRGWLGLRPSCRACGVHFDQYAGNWLGPTILAYGVGGIAALLAGLLLVPRFGFFSGLGPALVSVAALAVLAALRPIKAGWISLLWRRGLVTDERSADADGDCRLAPSVPGFVRCAEPARIAMRHQHIGDVRRHVLVWHRAPS